MVDAGWETIFGFLDTVADTYIYYILLSSIIIYCILLFIIYLILQTLQTADKMYKTTASGPSIRFMDHPLIKKNRLCQGNKRKADPDQKPGPEDILSDISIVRSNQSLWSPKSYPLVNVYITMENHHF